MAASMRLAEFCEQIRVHLVPPAGGADVKRANDPRHEELRESEEVSPVHLAQNRRLHRLRPVTDHDWQRHIVGEEEDGRWDDEAALGTLEGVEIWIRCD